MAVGDADFASKCKKRINKLLGGGALQLLEILGREWKGGGAQTLIGMMWS